MVAELARELLPGHWAGLPCHPPQPCGRACGGEGVPMQTLGCPGGCGKTRLPLWSVLSWEWDSRLDCQGQQLQRLGGYQGS